MSATRRLRYNFATTPGRDDDRFRRMTSRTTSRPGKAALPTPRAAARGGIGSSWWFSAGAGDAYFISWLEYQIKGLLCAARGHVLWNTGSSISMTRDTVRRWDLRGRRAPRLRRGARSRRPPCSHRGTPPRSRTAGTASSLSFCIFYTC